MTLKELRISKGLNQSDCADFLGMSRRNYQNYENDANKINTAKYKTIYKQLESYGSTNTDDMHMVNTGFRTNVVTGIGLRAFSMRVAKYKKGVFLKN